MNPIFNAFKNNSNMNNNPMNNFSNMLNQFNKFKANFQGDPRLQVQSLIDNGMMTQEQFNQLSELAKQFQGMMRH